jgi:hypothetical protein
MKKRPITHEQLAAKPFEPVPESANLSSRPTARERHEQQLHDIAVVSRIDLFGVPKSEAVQNLRGRVTGNNNAKSADERLRTFGKGARAGAGSGQAH